MHARYDIVLLCFDVFADRQSIQSRPRMTSKPFSVSIHDDIPADEGRLVDSGLGQSNEAAAPLHEVWRLSCFARCADGSVIGGAIGRTWEHAASCSSSGSRLRNAVRAWARSWFAAARSGPSLAAAARSISKPSASRRPRCIDRSATSPGWRCMVLVTASSSTSWSAKPAARSASMSGRLTSRIGDRSRAERRADKPRHSGLRPMIAAGPARAACACPPAKEYP